MNFKESERPWLIGGVLAALVISAAAWFMVVGPEFANATTVRGEVSDAQTQNLVLQSKTAKLKTQSEEIPQLVKQLANKLAQLPVDAEFSQLTAQLNQQASTAGVTISSLGFSSPAAVSGGTTSASSVGQTFSTGVTVSANGSIGALEAFLHQVQTVGPRAALFSTISLSPTGKAYALTASFTAFITPLSPAEIQALQSELDTVAPAK